MRTDSFSARLTPRFAVFMPKGLYAIACRLLTLSFYRALSLSLGGLGKS
ncbi:MAG: hypothetical protein AB1861_26250 [Cyanobacteriota bacterium]